MLQALTVTVVQTFTVLYNQEVNIQCSVCMYVLTLLFLLHVAVGSVRGDTAGWVDAPWPQYHVHAAGCRRWATQHSAEGEAALFQLPASRSTAHVFESRNTSFHWGLKMAPCNRKCGCRWTGFSQGMRYYISQEHYILHGSDIIYCDLLISFQLSH